jgi:hypothetical protein
LAENIHELQHKVRNAVDWRVQVNERPWTMVGLAFGTGLLTSVLISKARRGRGRSYRWQRPERWTKGESAMARSGYRNREREEKTSETWENIKSAVGTMALTAAKDFVRQILPAFRERYRENQRWERRKPNGSVDTPWQGTERRRSGPEYVHS